jgi:hypothetical protein
MFTSGKKKLITGALIAAGSGALFYYAFKAYKASIPVYSEEKILTVTKQIYKQSYPIIKQLQRESAACAKVYNVTEDAEKRKEILAAFKVKEIEFQKKLGDLILAIYKENEIESNDLLSSYEIWRKKKPSVMRYDQKVTELVATAIKGQFLDCISDDVDYLLKALDVRIIYSGATDEYCNKLLDMTEKFLEKKKADGERFGAKDVGTYLKQEAKGSFNAALERAIESSEALNDKPEHRNHLFDVSLLKIVQSNEEGIRHFLEQCDFVRELVMNTLTQFKPDETM